MTRAKQRVHRTHSENLISNLRGEVGEVITSWILLRHFMSDRRRLETGDLDEDLRNPEIALVSILTEKLRDELVGRLSELGEEKIGRLTFHFASQKLGVLQEESKAFTRLVVKHRLREKRNRDVSHKELPETWSDARHLHIDYRILLRVIACAVRLMKAFDRVFLGPAAVYSWRAARRRRYESTMSPPRAAYLLLPYLNLSERERLEIVVAESGERPPGTWSRMDTLVDGKPASVLVSKQWGVLHLGDRLLALPGYPLQELTSVNFLPDSGEESNDQADAPT